MEMYYYYFTKNQIDGFPYQQSRNPEVLKLVELGRHAHGKLEIDYDFRLHYRKMQIDDDLFEFI